MVLEKRAGSADRLNVKSGPITSPFTSRYSSHHIPFLSSHTAASIPLSTLPARTLFNRRRSLLDLRAKWLPIRVLRYPPVWTCQFRLPLMDVLSRWSPTVSLPFLLSFPLLL